MQASCERHQGYFTVGDFYIQYLASRAMVTVQSKKSFVNVDGTPTAIVCSNFGNQIFIYVTQYGRIGTMIKAEAVGHSHGIGASCVDNNNNSNNNTLNVYTCKVLFGIEEPTYVVLARQLIEEIFRSSNKNSIILAVSLKSKSARCLRCLKDTVLANRTW
ncbi:Proteasome assembly chaperone 3 [Trichoplax sp. H2]|nr:Proteasome assembly chaperone 3 [Trichoplax sp. H2]|eukprot:RDD46141.1 Proteasome assembly chaperone 3 [Trichoplax sp. H2]